MSRWPNDAAPLQQLRAHGLRARSRRRWRPSWHWPCAAEQGSPRGKEIGRLRGHQPRVRRLPRLEREVRIRSPEYHRTRLARARSADAGTATRCAGGRRRRSQPRRTPATPRSPGRRWLIVADDKADRQAARSSHALTIGVGGPRSSVGLRRGAAHVPGRRHETTNDVGPPTVCIYSEIVPERFRRAGGRSSSPSTGFTCSTSRRRRPRASPRRGVPCSPRDSRRPREHRGDARVHPRRRRPRAQPGPSRTPVAERGRACDALPDGEPQAVTLRVARQDGVTEVVDRARGVPRPTGDRVRALHSTCTHLGCRTRSTPRSKPDQCPCHGGVYDMQGKVSPGPPPRAAADAADAHRRRPRPGAGVTVRTRLLDWLDSRTGYRAGFVHLLDEPLPKGTGWAFTTGSVIMLLLGVQVRHRRRAGDVLRAGAGARLRQRALHQRETAVSAGWCAGCTSGARASSSSPRSCTCCGCSCTARLQGAARGDVADRRGAVAAHPRRFR